MTSRRSFLQMGAAVLALPLSLRADSSSAFLALGEPARVRLYKAIFDQRFPASRAFATEIQSLGVPVQGIKGDITEVWFYDLYARWKQEQAAIAGLTGYGSIFCLERLAWDHGMRVVFRGEHMYRANDSIEHALSGSESMLRQAAGLSASGANWPSRVAQLLTHCPVNQSQTAKITIATRAAQTAKADGEYLISWVIAPVKRV
jgi:hypothetical protein